MRIHAHLKMLFVTLLLSGTLVPVLEAQGPVYSRPRQASQDADFSIQGEYVGEVDDSGEKLPVGLQIVALGKGRFQGTGYLGGLPGDGWNGEEPLSMSGEKDDDGTITFTTELATVVYKDGSVSVLDDGDQIGSLKKTRRKSPTLGKKPPEGAIVLFDGTTGDAWDPGTMEGKLLKEGQTSKQKFADHTLHVEFRVPYAPEARGQGRGNSGLYLQGRYEVQILDSFGLEGKDNECGGVYSIKNPDANLCFPPLTWQTYDVEFTAARYDSSGQVVKNPKLTVRHNGVVIHQDVELPKATTAAPLKPGPEPGPVYLQDHGNPVRFRNVWAVASSEAAN